MKPDIVRGPNPVVLDLEELAQVTGGVWSPPVDDTFGTVPVIDGCIPKLPFPWGGLPRRRS
jgi:hypothetical protein